MKVGIKKAFYYLVTGLITLGLTLSATGTIQLSLMISNIEPIVPRLMPGILE